MRRVVFWQNALSIHQAPFLRELSNLDDLSVHVVAFGDLSSRRRAMGWSEADYGTASVHVAVGSAANLEALLASHGDAEVHVFSGFGAYSGMSDVQARLGKSSKARLIVVTEPWDDRGWRGWLRMRRAHRRVTRLAPQIDAVLACGSRARIQLQQIPAARSVPTYDFGYFVDRSDPPDHATGGPPQLIFVGDMMEHKAPLELVNALARMRDLEWELQMVGDGNLRPSISMAVERWGLADRVHLIGYKPYDAVRSAIASSDVLVLPSKYDGWGAVVNEALMDGTRVVVSDRAGASDLITDDFVGATFVSGSQASLEATLRTALRAPRTDEARSARREWARASISPAAAAAYFDSILCSLPEAASPPWHHTSSRGR